MTDSTNNSFENQWQNAFDDAELTPPASVWEKIELGLAPENTPPSKPNFGNKPYYFLGVVLVSLFGLFLWFNDTEEESQVVDKEGFESKIIIKKEPVALEKKVEIVGGYAKHGVKHNVKFVEVVGGDTNHGAESKAQLVDVIGEDTNHGAESKAKIVEVVGEDTNHGTEKTTTIDEVPIRTLTDSIEIITPLSTRNIHADIENPTIILPTDQTPYYVKPSIKPPKKSILKNVKISVGAGAYQP